MRILTGNTVRQMGPAEFRSMIQGYRSLTMDIGAGEGEFVYRNARMDGQTVYIGIDTSVDSMRRYAAKSAAKPEKGGLRNVLYVVADAADMPDTLEGAADRIIINLPWGSLRDGLIKGEHGFLSGIQKTAKPSATLEINVGYCDQYERHEMDRRQLPALSAAYLMGELKARYGQYGIDITAISVLGNEELRQIGTKWAKKLASGKRREAFRIRCEVTK